MDERIWTDRPIAQDEVLFCGSTKVSLGAPKSTFLVSGNLPEAISTLCPGLVLAGLCGDVENGAFGMRVARDQAVLVGLNLPADCLGWNAEGFAISQIDGGLAEFRISGPDAREILAEAASADLDRPSASAAILFAGCKAMLVQDQGAFGLWIEVGYLTYVTSYMRAVFRDPGFEVSQQA